MNKYLAAALAVAVFSASLSILAPRLAPIVLRIGVVALLVVGALWFYEYLTARPPPLARRVLDIVKARGPVTLKEIAVEAVGSYEEVAEAVEYLVQRGLLRRMRKGDEEYYDV
ncbi:hypothetical protein [Pyrobaculum arsenaticum]|uniref:Uncharacterized protein n=1 Tax=Pyrobaculum arsenaticum (strain DSM 13514 / JCM 11321 / PZ6) TaxID=340102 RepID=A4WMX6_PYRAR|nr:hypothetical protein [Pyrobaculum arsenaticum]ABP51743.1 conserved hypothetical protein [Pyrobaculum arsenaticum DSM 13514]